MAAAGAFPNSAAADAGALVYWRLTAARSRAS